MNPIGRHFLALLFLIFVWFEPEVLPEPLQRQDRPSTRSTVIYRLSFTLHVLSDSQDRKRQFVLTVGERRDGRIRALTKVPVRRGSEVEYIETGVKCDAEYEEIEGGIRLEVEMHFSELAPITGEQAAADTPLIYEWQSQVQKTVAPNEPTLLSSYDDEQGKRRYQLEVIAEKLR
jgi:hypothetical protein